LAPGEKATLHLWSVEIPMPVSGPIGAKPTTCDVQLHNRLVAAGLNDGEAASLVACWYDALFVKGEDGLTLLHRLPQETYESMLPLTATPAPRSVVRVGLVAFTHLEPSLAADVNALIDRLVAAAPAEQFDVMTKLKSYGGAAFPMLRARIAAQGPGTELCQRLLAEQEIAKP
jgi:hypothetical protein